MEYFIKESIIDTTVQYYLYYLLGIKDGISTKNKTNFRKKRKSTSKYKKIRILIIDDEAITRETLAAILRERGYEVITAKDGYEAIENTQHIYIDFAIVDIKLPGIDGVETFKILKKRFPKMKGIMITAYPSSSFIQNALDSGALTCIFKPFDIDSIISIIEDICKNEEKN